MCEYEPDYTLSRADVHGLASWVRAAEYGIFTVAARTGEAGTQRHAELARLVGALLRHGYAVSEAPVLGDALLAAAEEEARLLQAAGRMQPSTIKRAGSGAARHRDAAARGDVVQWLVDGDASSK